ncbi:hypothetical protein DM01DRAFT_1316117 [Hesseltinella vesiculosa]|uniref:TRP C-terminal domain-containing protein n=1 Tax=Hesseltinella vesiculosa TaxID=101127 RepID=A0A1X2GTS7_9FUNG|nr:hypothetical protein DM01DRAFT_1316117 [Hesseltinella vesiculosa]
MTRFQKIVQRINHNRLTQCYVAIALIQGIILVVLEAAIASENVLQSQLVPDTNTAALERLNRIKWENIAFIGLQVWVMSMAVDATVHQNAAEVFALAFLYVIYAVLGGLQILDNDRWQANLSVSGSSSTFSLTPLITAHSLEIALTVCLAVFAVLFVYISYKLVLDFGWEIYKKIGADLSIQKMYRAFQYFVLCLKIDIFVEFLVSCFYFLQFVIKPGNVRHWQAWIFLVITVSILPMLWLARQSVAKESKAQMIGFLIFQILVIFEFVLVLIGTSSDAWYIWICFVSIGVVFAVVTIVFGCICINNFNRGLFPFVQRGSMKSQLEDANRRRSDNGYSNISWNIDEE